MLQVEVFVLKLLAVDTDATCPISLDKVASLDIHCQQGRSNG